MRVPWRPGAPFLVFLALWLIYGATITKYNLYDFTLQQAVIESIVERGTFEVGASEVPMLKAAGDKFMYNGRWLPAKQPGQFAFGAPVYLVCRLLGITYASHYLLAGAIVTWLTASLMSAVSSAFLVWLLRDVWGFCTVTALFATLCHALGTNLLPYSGIAHHDVIALSFLLISFCLLEYGIRKEMCQRWSTGCVAGLLLGLTLFTSMLPAVIVATLFVYVALTASRRFALWTAAGTALGLLPLALYNWHYFGNPLVQANIAGRYTETFFSPEPQRFLDHLNVYLGTGDLSVVMYMPIVILGLAGQWLLGTGLRSERWLLVAIVALHLLYILNIPFVGACQYGPRLMLPALPFAAMGLPGLLAWTRRRRHAVAIAFLVYIVAVYSFLVNAVGSLVGTMFCETYRFAFLVYLRMPLGRDMDSYPLALTCLALCALLCGRPAARALVAGQGS
jgi:hypothetical protein